MRKALYLITLALAAACACQKTGDGIPQDWPWNDPDADDKPFVEVTDGTFGTLPDGIRLYTSPEVLQGKPAVAYIATVDLSKHGFHVWGIKDPVLTGSEDALQTPTEVYNKKDSPVLVMNGGYFYVDSGTNYSASLAVEEGELLSPNINYASEDWVTIYYPTKGAFIRHSDGTMEASWTYWADVDNHWIYDVPAQNGYGSTPVAQPDAKFPSDGRAFEAKTAIGAGPVLIKNGQFQNTWRYECLPGDYDVNCLGRAPRTAVGCTADGLLVLFVCEGRDMTEGVPGYSTEDVANILLGFGCKEALNLDGGGSTCLLVNGLETIKPSDGQQRSVGNCIYIK